MMLSTMETPIPSYFMVVIHAAKRQVDTKNPPDIAYVKLLKNGFATQYIVFTPEDDVNI